MNLATPVSRCQFCSTSMPSTRSSNKPRRFCSKLCANRSNSGAVNARHASLDEMAVIRLISGSPVTSTKAERLEAVRQLTSHGYSLFAIASRLHTTDRSVSRYRAELHRKALAA